jgi:hypothetical protein
MLSRLSLFLLLLLFHWFVIATSHQALGQTPVSLKGCGTAQILHIEGKWIVEPRNVELQKWDCVETDEEIILAKDEQSGEITVIYHQGAKEPYTKKCKSHAECNNAYRVEKVIQNEPDRNPILDFFFSIFPRNGPKSVPGILRGSTEPPPPVVVCAKGKKVNLAREFGKPAGTYKVSLQLFGVLGDLEGSSFTGRKVIFAADRSTSSGKTNEMEKTPSQGAHNEETATRDAGNMKSGQDIDHDRDSASMRDSAGMGIAVNGRASNREYETKEFHETKEFPDNSVVFDVHSDSLLLYQVRLKSLQGVPEGSVLTAISSGEGCDALRRSYNAAVAYTRSWPEGTPSDAAQSFQWVYLTGLAEEHRMLENIYKVEKQK